MTTSQQRMPTAYITHGGGPCFFMDWDPPHEWDSLRSALEYLPQRLPEQPRAILVISAHWESREVAISSNPSPPLIYDYGGFPPHTYELTYPAPGNVDVAREAAALLDAAGIDNRLDPDRGWDHGVFIPLKVIYPNADIPIVSMSVRHDLDPQAHLEIGQALAPLRDQGVFILASGSSFHHFGNFGTQHTEIFDKWANEVMAQDPSKRWESLKNWESAPSARQAHGREEHWIPLMVAVGAAGGDPAHTIFNDVVMHSRMSCWLFGETARPEKSELATAGQGVS